MPLKRSLSTTISVLLILALAVALAPVGCAPVLMPEPAWEKDAQAMLDQAEALNAKKQYGQAARVADDFFIRYPKSRHGDRALHLLGDIYVTRRDYRQAMKYYIDLIERFPSSALTADSKYKLGLCYFEIKEYDLAIANLQDKSRISEPAKIKRSSEMLAAAYTARNMYLPALKEYIYLAAVTTNTRQQAGYRDRIREIVDKYLTEDELRQVAAGNSYPADITELRLAAVLIDQRRFKEAIDVSRDFLARFPSHPETTRAEMLITQATAMMTAPRYYLGVLVPQTGQISFFGDHVLKGVQLAVHAYNLLNPDNRVETVVKDTEGMPDKAAVGIADISGKVTAAVGPITTREEEAVAAMLDKLQIPVIRPAASRSGLAVRSPWMFRNGLTIDSQAHAASEYALGMKLSRFVPFYPDEPYGKDLARLFAQDLDRKADILTSIAYPPDTKDFGPYIRKVMEIDLRSRKIPIPEDEAERKKLLAEYTPGFDALYMPGYAERVGLLIPQLAFYNITGIAMIGSDNWHSRELIERAGRHADGAVFTDGFFPESRDPAIKTFVESYRSAYQEEPDILAAQAYDSANMILALFKEGKDTPLAVRDGLLAIRDYPGVSGLTTFGGNNEAQKKIFLIKIQDEQFMLLKTE